jgi:hypothetical protein
MADTLAHFGIMTAHDLGSNTDLTQATARILEADDTDEVDLQLKYETLVAIYKVKRLLMWVLVVVPLVLVGLGVVVYAATSVR